MLFIVITTPLCNLRCRYCGGDLLGMPPEIQYTVDDLARMIRRYKAPIVAFYGGEPLLKPELVTQMIETLPASHFVINTNGYFIKSIEDVLPRFDAILLSIDGRENTTDLYRQPGCYQRVMEAVDCVNRSGFTGELIARMTVSGLTDIYADVTHLLNYFPLVHWQLDAVWSNLWDLTGFKTWVDASYKPRLLRLIDWWISHVKEGRIPGIIPFLGIMTRLLHGGEGLPCASGCQSVTVTTGGTILACPIAPEYSWNVLGDFNGITSVHIGEPCTSCRVFTICGGRCLFAYKEQLWGLEGFNVICQVTQFLIDELQKHVPECEPFKEQFRYPPFNNTTEIIP
jgi:putative peptide-modifying radical SAM enzyme